MSEFSLIGAIAPFAMVLAVRAYDAFRHVGPTAPRVGAEGPID